MTYKSYIKKDYKTGNGQKTIHQSLIAKHHFPYLLIAVSVIASIIFYGSSNLKTPTSVMITEDNSSVSDIDSAQDTTELSEITDSEDFHEHITGQLDTPQDESSMPELEIQDITGEDIEVWDGASGFITYNADGTSSCLLEDFEAEGTYEVVDDEVTHDFDPADDWWNGPWILTIDGDNMTWFTGDPGGAGEGYRFEAD